MRHLRDIQKELQAVKERVEKAQAYSHLLAPFLEYNALREELIAASSPEIADEIRNVAERLDRPNFHTGLEDKENAIGFCDVLLWACSRQLGPEGESGGSGPAESGAPPPAPARPPVDYICNMCGGNKVTRDAWAEWDADEQEWTLGAALDRAFCHDCDEETRLVEVDRETREPTGD